MKFFIDNNLSAKLAAGMKGFGEEVVHLTEVFPGDTDDEEWLRFVGDNGWVVITRDERIRRRKAQREALRDHKVGAIFLGGKSRGRCDLIQQLVRNWDKIKEVATARERPFAVRIRPNGRQFDTIDL